MSVAQHMLFARGRVFFETLNNLTHMSTDGQGKRPVPPEYESFMLRKRNELYLNMVTSCLAGLALANLGLYLPGLWSLASFFETAVWGLFAFVGGIGISKLA